MEFAVVDIETTGGRTSSTFITEIAIIIHDGHQVLDSYNTLVNPTTPIPEFITRLTGISDQMVATAPKFYEVAKKVVEMTKNRVFVAHNVGFDYRVLRQEFKRLGYDFRRDHLCTVQTSRILIPGQPSYSLGKLSRNLGIQLNQHHRALEDTKATADIFAILYKNAKEDLKNFIKKELNPKILHEALDLEIVEGIPQKPGVYFLKDDNDRVIYIGKSNQLRKRVETHLRGGKTRKSIEMREKIAKVDFIETGNELMALLREALFIKKIRPKYNTALRSQRFPIGLYQYKDQNGYIHLYVGSNSKNMEEPIMCFKSLSQAQHKIKHLSEQYNLCEKYTKVNNHTSGPCFGYTIQQCNGACIQEEAPDIYNSRVESAINSFQLPYDSFLIIGRGRKKTEISAIEVRSQKIWRIGYANYDVLKKSPEAVTHQLEAYPHYEDVKAIIKHYVEKAKGQKIIPL